MKHYLLPFISSSSVLSLLAMATIKILSPSKQNWKGNSSPAIVPADGWNGVEPKISYHCPLPPKWCSSHSRWTRIQPPVRCLCCVECILWQVHANHTANKDRHNHGRLSKTTSTPPSVFPPLLLPSLRSFHSSSLSLYGNDSIASKPRRVMVSDKKINSSHHIPSL